MDDELVAAVKRYLDDFYRDDIDGSRISWPGELEEMVGWTPPQEEED